MAKTKPRTTRKAHPTRSAQATATSSGLPGRVVFEAFGDLVDPLEYLRDTSGWNTANIATAWQASHRKSGSLAPAFDTEEALWQIQGAARIIAEVSPHAKCALNNLTNYVIGKGFVYQVKDRVKIRKPDDPGSPLAEECDAVIQEFLERHKWPVRFERELYRRAHRDGEYFLGLYHTGGGITEARVIEPALIKKPQNVAELDDQYGDGDPADWEFGVHTRADDIAQPLGYHVQWSDSPADFDYFTPDRVAHCKVGVDQNVKRGLSDFYAITDYLGDGAKLLRNAGKGAAVLAGIAAIIEHPPAVTGAQIESFRAGGAYSQTTETTPQGGRQKFTHQYGPATMMHVKNGQKYLPSPLASAGVGDSVVKIEQAILRTVGSNWSMPEYMISGDASNANYSSTLVAESPFVKFCEAEQAVYCEEYRSILWLVLRIALEGGRISDVKSFDELRRAVQIQVEPPRVASRNGLQESQQSALLHEKGVLSIETWSAREGLDRKQEVANGAKVAEPAPAPFGQPTQPTMESARDRLQKAAGTLWEGYP